MDRARVGWKMSYLLDTTLLVDIVGGFPGALELFETLVSETDRVFTCDVVVCESLSTPSPVERRGVEGILNVLEYVATDPFAARWAAASRASGRAIRSRRGLGDALIAGVAVGLGATVVTRNPRDFERQGVPVLRYG
jgi:predicted nucleic acid-binding protein